MSTASNIEWTNATWNPVSGCTRVSAGCDHCYAVAMTHRLEAMGQAKYAGLTVLNAKGDRHFNGVVRMHEDALAIPLGWRKPRRIFVNSMSDLFHKEVPFGFVMRVLNVMAQCPRHTFQILTKRPDRMADFFQRWGDLSGEDFEPKLVRGPQATRKAHPSGRGQLFADMLENMGDPPVGAAYPTFDWMEGMIGWPKTFGNIWLGTSIENQATADERIPHLLNCPAAVRFLSCEPLLGPVNLQQVRLMDEGLTMLFPLSGEVIWESRNEPASLKYGGIDWVITGGESGPDARLCNIDWIRSIVAQCKAAEVPVFVKQVGSDPYFYDDGSDVRVVLEVSDRKGGDPSGWPEDIRVRELPAAAEDQAPHSHVGVTEAIA